MSDKNNIPPFRPAFGALNPVLIAKPKNAQEFIANAEAVMKMSSATAIEQQTLQTAIERIKNGQMRLGDWPCIAVFLQIATLAQNLEPLD